ncbi:hypothetical protein [Arthrobacter sp. efr-133-TYG-118]|uniref:hypothetical protein n=1 Tax=Arthrobacter sp. efr-133-TYG-118 TaxID=3040279 RepID=UPI00254C4B2C|nr:hypothetical protein [Arthrobacter sp. efr-133-TYG-118]
MPERQPTEFELDCYVQQSRLTDISEELARVQTKICDELRTQNMIAFYQLVQENEAQGRQALPTSGSNTALLREISSNIATRLNY